jgi:hypothetical protein
MKGQLTREQRLQVMLSPDEIEALDDFRFTQRTPSRMAAVGAGRQRAARRFTRRIETILQSGVIRRVPPRNTREPVQKTRGRPVLVIG